MPGEWATPDRGSSRHLFSTPPRGLVRRCHPGGPRLVSPDGVEPRALAAHTAALEDLADWLTREGVAHAAMEPTGVYWKPVFNILEGRLTVLLVNPRHMKQRPGRKTDVGDVGPTRAELQCDIPAVAQVLDKAASLPTLAPAAKQLYPSPRFLTTSVVTHRQYRGPPARHPRGPDPQLETCRQGARCRGLPRPRTSSAGYGPRSPGSRPSGTC